MDSKPSASPFHASDDTGNMKQETASFGYPRVSNIEENLYLTGFMPAVMRYCRRSESFQTRIFSARFLKKMLRWGRSLHMFIACRRFVVSIDMLEPDIEPAES